MLGNDLYTTQLAPDSDAMGPTTLRQILAVEARQAAIAGACGLNSADLVTLHRQTLAAGTTYAALPSHACLALSHYNDTGTSIDFRLGAGTNGAVITVASAGSKSFPVVANANEWWVRRNDGGTVAGGTAAVVVAVLALNFT